MMYSHKGFQISKVLIMGKVDRNTHDMPVPDFAYTDRHDGRVFVRIIDSNGMYRKKTIGYMTVSNAGGERMIPNQYFIDKYRDLYMESYPDATVPFHEISIGMYALTLGITTNSGLYDDLVNVYGPIFANGILDYAMFSIMHRCSATQIFETSMAREVLFEDKLHSDNWYSDFFSKKLNEDKHHQFRIKWVNRLKSKGLKKVWLAIDGSNNDCEARRTFLTKHGFPKSHNKNKTIVGYMYAVDASTGQPVTYFVYDGSVPDSQAFQKVATFLGSFDLEIEGVILDRGFAVENVFKTIEEHKWKYVIMLPSDTHGHVQMAREFGETIRWKSEYIIEDDALFGISGNKKLFGMHERRSDICLYYDGAGGSIRSIKLIKKIQAAVRKAKLAISQQTKAAIPQGLQKYITIDGEGPERKITVHYQEWDKSMASHGFFSLAVSEGIDPSRANRLYSMRNVSEIQYSILKSHEGGGVSRVHSTEGIYSKFATAFVASLIRYEIETACQQLELDTNPMIQNMEQVILLYTAEAKYESVRNLTAEAKALLGKFSIDQDTLERLAIKFNDRSKTDSKNPVRAIPESGAPVIRSNSHIHGKPAAKKEHKDSDSSDDGAKKEKSKGGRPKGKKDSKPRKGRSDKGKSRGSYKKNKN